MSFKTSESTANIYPAWIEAQANMPKLLKESKAHHGKYAGIDDIIHAAYPWLTKYGLGVFVGETWFDAQLFVTCRIVHKSNEYIEGMIPVFVIPLEKDTIQALGGRITYLSRYLLRSMLGFHNAEFDDDGDYETVNTQSRRNEVKTDYINQEQIDQLENMMADYPEMKTKLLNFYKITSLAFIPSNKFWEMHDAILKIKDRYKQQSKPE